MREQEPINLGRYQPLRVIGHGGMGQVFEAWDPQLERRVALKVLRRPESVESSGDDLALREARCLARVAHPHVVGVHEVGHCDGLVFIAMELVDGPDLGRWLCERPRRWTDVLDRLLDAARGLAEVHRAGLVHGDVKPGNMLIGRDGRVRIADFGLARVRSRAAGPELTQLVRQVAAVVEAELTGTPPTNPMPRQPIRPIRPIRPIMSPPVVGGTIAYMAPECLSGGEGDRRSDQYSFCVMAWEALFGVRPYPGQSAERILGSIAAGRVDRGRGRPRGMPSGIEAVLSRGLSEDPDRRWLDIDALISELLRRRWRGRAVVRGLGIGALVATTMMAGLVLAQERPRGSEPEQCAVERLRIERAWGPSERILLEQRAMRSSIVLPRREVRFVSAHLDAWVEEWSRLWPHACAVDSAGDPGDPVEPAGHATLRDCLIGERERLEAVVALLLDEQREPSVAVGRTLMVELELPTVCLDRARRTASARDLAHLAELSEVEHGIEVALAVEDLDDAAEQLAELDARVGRLLEAEQSAPAARVRLAYWQARLLHAEGRHREAERVLRWALADAERLGLERLRWDLLLARARLSADMGESVLDEVAALDRLADRLGQGHEARAEIAIVEASASQDPLESIERIDRAIDEIGRVGLSSRSSDVLMFELRVVRSKLHTRVANVEEALVDARLAVSLARRPSILDVERLARAHVLLAETAVPVGECDFLTTALDDLARTLSEESQNRGATGRPIRDLGWVLEFLHSFEVPAECVDGQDRAWMLTQLSTNGGGLR
jgi:tetratricopeptide (TPR) repeat protein